jgi:hypothetical protein
MFCDRLRIIKLTEWRDLPDAVEDVRTGRQYAKHRVVMQTDDGVYINQRTVKGFALGGFIREAVDRYSYVNDFILKAQRTTARPEDVTRSATPYNSAEFDRVLNVAQSMGQWAWAYCAILDLLGVQGLNARNIVWSGFPHMSRIGVTVGGRILWLAGAARQVLEYWFTAHGGYHSKHEYYVSDRQNYERACNGVSSPWVLASVDRAANSLQGEWLVESGVTNVHTPTAGDSVCDGVLYRANQDGALLPIGYAASDVGVPATARTGWVLEDRVRLLGRMAVPFNLREEILHGKAD